jgi:hypothetical protein
VLRLREELRLVNLPKETEFQIHERGRGLITLEDRGVSIFSHEFDEIESKEILVIEGHRSRVL